MFNNNNGIFAYKISLILDNYLLALFNLCFDVQIKIENIELNDNEIEYATGLFNDNFYDLVGINKHDYLSKDTDDLYVYTKDQFFESLSAKLNHYFLVSDHFIGKLNTKEFLYYFKDTKTIYSTFPKESEIRNNLNNKIKSIGIISIIIDNILNEDLKDSIKSIAKIYDFDKSGQYINVSGSKLKPQLFCIPKEFIKIELFSEEVFDIDYFWMNSRHVNNLKLNFDKDETEISLLKVKANNTVVGAIINDYLLLKYAIDFDEFIKDEKRNEFLWQLLKENLLKKKDDKFNHKTEIIEQFNNASKNPEFNKLLSNLKYNLYIDNGIVIQAEYKDFFEEFILVDKLDDLADLNLFLPDKDDSSGMIGVYSNKKIGEKYNLLNHIKHKNAEKIIRYNNSNPIESKKVKVNILKSDLSYYFIEKYFENIIEDILQKYSIPFISNSELFIGEKSKAEFDFIIFANNRFYFLEAKTTLSKDNVYQTLVSYTENINLLKNIKSLNISDIDFYLIGLLSNKNIDNYQYFLQENDDYNVNRNGYKVMPYKFEVPFMSHKDINLHCLSEPEISKLENYIKELCQI